MGNVGQFVSEGGFVLWLLAGFSLLALMLCLAKLWQLHDLRARQGASSDDALKLLEKAEHSQAVMLVKNQRNLRARVLAESFNAAANTALSGQDLQEECSRFAKNACQELQRYLRPLEVISTVAPLIGLLGTVLGMIEAFHAMEQAGANINPAVLSGGIWQALLTTAAGLGVAIPTSLAHSAFEHHAEAQALKIEDDLTRFFTLQTGLQRKRAVATNKVSA